MSPKEGPAIYSHMRRRCLVESRLTSGMLYVRMKALRQFGVLVLLLVTSFAPAMACTVLGAKMNAQERTCCRTMSDRCGQTQMQRSQGCCQKTPASLYDHALRSNTVEFHPVAVRFISVAPFELMNPIAAVTAWVEHPDYAPPKSPPSTVSILRI